MKYLLAIMFAAVAMSTAKANEKGNAQEATGAGLVANHGHQEYADIHSKAEATVVDGKGVVVSPKHHR